MSCKLCCVIGWTQSCRSSGSVAGVRGSSPASSQAGNSSRVVGLFISAPKGVK